MLALLEPITDDFVCDCDDPVPVPYTSDGPLGHGWECDMCGGFLQAG